MVIITLGLFLIAVLVSAGEVYYEHDWPRDTFRYVVLSGLCLLASLAF